MSGIKILNLDQTPSLADILGAYECESNVLLFKRKGRRKLLFTCAGLFLTVRKYSGENDSRPVPTGYAVLFRSPHNFPEPQFPHLCNGGGGDNC